MTLFDRAAHLRSSPDGLEAELNHPEARYTPVWRGKSLISEDKPPRAVWLPCRREDLGSTWAYLGRDPDGRPHFAAGLDATKEPESLALPGRFVDLLRAGWTMPGSEFEPLAYARGMMHWHQAAQACERCGGTEMQTSDAGFKKTCMSCGATVFPRTDPAVMILVTRDDRCLLARQPRFPPQMYSALAGFVEPGESLEGCVLRETKEEVGLDVTNPRYLGSQPWPFPQSLMVGFQVEAVQERFTLDEEELEEARWFSRDELKNPDGFFYPPPMSLAHHLIRRFVDKG